MYISTTVKYTLSVVEYIKGLNFKIDLNMMRFRQPNVWYNII